MSVKSDRCEDIQIVTRLINIAMQQVVCLICVLILRDFVHLGWKHVCTHVVSARIIGCLTWIVNPVVSEILLSHQTWTTKRFDMKMYSAFVGFILKRGFLFLDRFNNISCVFYIMFTWAEQQHSICTQIFTQKRDNNCRLRIWPYRRTTPVDKHMCTWEGVA